MHVVLLIVFDITIKIRIGFVFGHGSVGRIIRLFSLEIVVFSTKVKIVLINALLLKRSVPRLLTDLDCEKNNY